MNRMLRRIQLITCFLSVSMLVCAFGRSYADIVVTLPRSDRSVAACATSTAPITQSYILTKASDPSACLVFLPGGGGKIGLNGTFLQINSNNFLVRSRSLFAALGFNVATMDAASDFQSCPFGLKGYRLGEESVSDIVAVIADLRLRYPGLPIWVVGTSRGSISAAQVAALLYPEAGGPDGLVLTSSVTRSAASAKSDNVFDVSLQAIEVPSLVVYHRLDGCSVTPPEDQPKIRRRLDSSDKVHLRAFSNAFPELSAPCEALSHHGYFGIEPEVAEYIATWIRSNLPALPGVEYVLDARFLQYRSRETAASNNYAATLFVTKDGAPIAQEDVASVRWSDDSGASILPFINNFYQGNSVIYDCITGARCSASETNANGLAIFFSSLPRGTYTVEVETSDGHFMTADIVFAGTFVLPVVASSTMQSQWVNGDLELSWLNPTDDPGWDHVSELRITAFDDANKDVLYIPLPRDATHVTVPAKVADQAKGLGNGTLARWEIQTRTWDGNGNEYARGYSNRLDLAGP